MSKSYYMIAFLSPSDNDTAMAAALGAALAPRPVAEINPGCFVIGLHSSQDYQGTFAAVTAALGQGNCASAAMMSTNRWFSATPWDASKEAAALNIVRGAW